MILFEEDWKKYPLAIADTKTTNRSWVGICHILKKMGVKNHMFPLALHTPELVGVDPWDPDLSEETKLAILMECTYNPWYFFREIVRIPPQSGDNPRPLGANRGNISMYWSFFNHVDFALVQIRQTGKSVSSDCLMLGLMYAFSSNTTMGLFTKDDSLRRFNIGRLKKAREYLPSYIYHRSADDVDNQTEFTYAVRNNAYKTGVAQKNEISANNLGRGQTMPIQQWDEIAFMTLVQVTLHAALASARAGREEAAEFGKPYGNIYTTTAGRVDTKHGKYVYDFFKEAAPWNEIYYDAPNRQTLYAMIRTNCKPKKNMVPKIMFYATFNHRQLGYSDDWLRNAISDAAVSGQAANMDFFNIWENGSTENPVPEEVRRDIRASETDPVFLKVERDYYITSWYIPENEIDEFMNTYPTVLGLDTSEAVGQDGIGFVLKDVRDMSTIAAMAINETNLYRYGKFIARFLVEHKKCTLMIEKKTVAQAIIDALLVYLPEHGEDPFRRIFNRVVDESKPGSQEYNMVVETPMHRRNPDVYQNFRKQFGFNTTGKSRDLLYSTVLSSYTRKAANVIRDKRLIDEICGLEVRNGRVDHANKGHDDMVVSALLCEYFVTRAKNLTFYGVDPLQIRTVENRKKKENKTPSEEMGELLQEQYREEIETLYAKLKKTHDVVEISNIEHRLQRLSVKLEDQDDEFLSIDAMIQQANQEREHRRRARSLQRRSVGS